MSLQPDWEAIAQERGRAWDAVVRRRQLLAQVPRRRPAWQRWAGGALMFTGRWLTQWGKEMAGCEYAAQAPVVDNPAG